MRNMVRRLALLEKRQRDGISRRREPVTSIEFRIVDFPGWTRVEPGSRWDEDHPGLRKSP